MTIEQILAWADAHYAATGIWPKDTSGPILGAEFRTWRSVQFALQQGQCDLPNGTTLPRLLAEHREVRNHLMRPDLTTNVILEWADNHHAQMGEWPHVHSGTVLGALEETWGAINAALSVGLRSLPGGSSLASLLREEAERLAMRPANHGLLWTAHSKKGSAVFPQAPR